MTQTTLIFTIVDVRELAKCGYTRRQISDRLGLSYAFVTRVIAQESIPVRRETRRVYDRKTSGTEHPTHKGGSYAHCDSSY